MIAAAAWTELIARCEQAYPREACGWLAGADPVAADRVRPAATGDRDRFAFTDDDLLDLVAATRGPATPRALFHSHPDGDAVLSPADLAALAPGGVVLHPLPHLVVAVAGGRAHAAALYAWAGGAPVLARRWRRTAAGWSA